MWKFWGEKEVLTRFWLGNLKESDHLEDLGIEIINGEKYMLNKSALRSGTRLIIQQDTEIWRAVINESMKFRVS
jgi:hypothetical protein